MARNYILGGMGATQLQAGKPYFKRIIRINGTSYVNGALDAGTADGQLDHPDNHVARTDGLTCKVVTADGANKGSISFTTAAAGDAGTAATDGKAKNWGSEGELLMVEFPTTLRSVEINLEEAWSAGALEDPLDGAIRVKAMLTAPDQDVTFDKTTSAFADPIGEGSFIEIKTGETATISSRTKVVFLLIQKFDSNTIFKGTGGPPATSLSAAGELAGSVADAVSILITGVLDHEPTSGGSQAANEPNSQVIAADGTTKTELRKIWGKGEGVG